MRGASRRSKARRFAQGAAARVFPAGEPMRRGGVSDMSSSFHISVMRALIFSTLMFCAPAEPFADQNVSLTVYSQDLAFVREVRDVSLERGSNDISFENVPSKLDPSSVKVSFPGGGESIRVLRQSYRFDVAGMGRLLDLALGREVSVRVEEGEILRGTLIGHDGESLIVREGTSAIREADEAILALRRESVIEVRFQDMGESLVLRPTLAWQVDAQDGGSARMEVGYLTSGMSWTAEYVAAFAEDEGRLELSAWASVDNRSGGDFEDASLTLVAGRINRAAEIRPRRMEMAAAAPPSTDFGEQEFFEYHSYVLERPFAIENNESVQVPLFQPAWVRFERVYTFDPTRFAGGVKVTAETENVQERGLGVPLPRGKVRVYAPAGGDVRLVGEDMLSDSPVGSEIELSLGLAFDVKGERKRTAFVRHGPNDYEESYDITLRNSKSSPVEVNVLEHPRGDWKVTETTHTFEEEDSNTIKWTISVPPSGEITVSYTVQFRS